MTPSDHEFELDRQLRDVPVPADLAARLKSIPEAAAIDDALDRELSTVELPPTLVEQLHQIASQELVTRRINERIGSRRSPLAWVVGAWATAAAILAAFGIGWALQSPWRTNLAQSDPLPSLPENGTQSSQSTESDLAWLDLPVSTSQTSAPAIPSRWVDADLRDPKLANLAFETSSSQGAADLHSLSEELPADLLSNTFLMRWQPLGANPTVTSPHGLPRLLIPSRSPVSYFPETKEYDRDFLLRESEHPFASPQQSTLGSTSVKVSTAQESFENVVFSKKPWSPELIENARAEQWLAATGRFYVPAQSGQLELRTAAGPAIFARTGTQMLQVGIVAGSNDSGSRSPVHLTVAVTPPENADQAARTWQPLKIALRETIDRLQPHDTITLVVMSEFPFALIEDVTPAHRDEWFAALDRIVPDNSVNLAEGIRFAAATSLTKPGFGDIRRPLMVFSDRFPGLDQTTNRQLRPLIENVAQQGIDLTWVELENKSYDSIIPAPEAVEGLGQWVVSDSLRRLSHLLDSKVSGHSTLIGSHAQVDVHWNSKSVQQYRLIGYQPLGGDFVTTDDLGEFHANESATLLFEVVLAEEGPNDVATVGLTWQDAHGKYRKSAQKVSRLQFASSWQASPLSLQAAQIAQQALALQQNSYFSRRRGNTLDELKTWSSALSPALQQHASFPRLKLLLPEQPGMIQDELK